MTFLDRINRWVGRTVSWLTLFMVLNTVAIIVARDGFGFGRIWMQELTTWMHAAVFLLGIAYTLAHDEHVRVDIFYQRFGDRGRALIDAIGCVFLLIPTSLYLLIASWDYVFGPLGSWASREASAQAGGLGFPAPAILKTLMIVMPVLLLLQSVVILSRCVQTWRRETSQ
ncbi:MAG: TRAP transporter small permease subunit [Pseudomonadota bacterium]